MPSVTYMNQSAPFWDFLASLEQQGNSHPFFSQPRNEENERSQEHAESHEEPAFGPWGLGASFFGGRGMPHRGQPSRGTPGCPYAFATNFEAGAEEHDKDKSKEKDNGNNDEKMKDNNDNGEGPSGNSGSENEGHAGGRDRHGRSCGGPRRRGPCGARGRHHGPHEGSHRGPGGLHGPHRGPGSHGRRGGWGPWGRGGLFDNAGFDPANLAQHFWNQFIDTQNNTDATAKGNEDIKPDADVFDTESAYVVHISLPGAKKEDVGVNWDAEKSELSVAGVIYRPGDEEFLKTLAMTERKVGPFERKLRLGTRASPAHIDADGITAKLEDGILRVEVPKLDTGYVEIKKVDIE
jgi:HSP20 family protein